VVWTIDYARGARKAVERMDPQVRRRIRAFLSERVAMADDPRQFGAALQGAHLAGLWRFRVGDWRIIADIRDDVLVVLVIDIAHRREVYR
jgi:mRNA interferase RelE/StbE